MRPTTPVVPSAGRSLSPRAGVRSAPIVLLLGASFLAVGALHSPFAYSARDLLLLGGIYLFLAATLQAGATLALRLHPLLGLLASLAVGAFFVLQVRVDAERLVSLPAAGGTAVGLGAAHFALLRLAGSRTPGEGRRGPAFGVTLASGALFLGLLTAGWNTPAVRWQLLRQHRTLGQTVYLFAGRGIRRERESLWARQAERVSAAERANAVVPARPAGGAGSPHVVVVLIDTLRADMLAAWGGDPDLMPRTNELAARSLVLTDVQANASWTRASCASLFTGLLPEEHGAVDFHDRLAEGWWTLPELLRDAGYGTAAFVANWVQVGVTTGFAQGFDEFQELQPLEEFERVMEAGGKNIREHYARAEQVNEAVLAWLARGDREEGRPQFLYVHYLDPHSPYLAGGEPGGEESRHARKLGAYRQEVRYLDEHLGLLFDALARELHGPLALVFTSDHGEEFWEHGAWGHGHSLYREQLQVPTFVYLTEGRGGEVLDTPLESRDLFGLVLALADPAPLDVSAWVTAHARSARYASQYIQRALDARPDRRNTALRLIDDGRSTLIWSGYGPSWQLFDRGEDPGETLNRIGLEAERVPALRRAMDEMPRFWAERPRVQRSERDLEFLRALGYFGGTTAGEGESVESPPAGDGVRGGAGR